MAFDLLPIPERFPAVRQTTIRSAFPGEPGKVCKYGRDQIAMAGVGWSQLRGVRIQEVARLGGRLRVMVSRRERMVMPRCQEGLRRLFIVQAVTVRPFDSISYRFLEEIGRIMSNCTRLALYSATS